MAKSNWGITSGFIGKLGNVVGFNWKGKNIQRALVQTSDPKSEGQQLNRAKFAIITRMGSDLYEAVYEGYRNEASHLKTTQNGLFLKDNFSNVSGETPETLVVNYEGLKLSSEKLRGVEFGEASLNENTLSVSIADSNLYGRRVSAADRVYLVAYCPERREAKCVAVGTRTETEALTLNLPGRWTGKRVYAYGFTIGAAPFNDRQASKTEYLGTFGSESQADTENGNQGSQSQDSQNTQTETETVEAPTISGNTSFSDSTQVTITGPAQAEIRYTTNGNVPTAESTLYSEPLTLTSTTTVKAIAIKNGISSEVTSKTFTKSTGGGTE